MHQAPQPGVPKFPYYEWRVLFQVYATLPAIFVIMLLNCVAKYFMVELNRIVCSFKCEQCTEAASKGLANHKPLKHSHLKRHTFLGWGVRVSRGSRLDLEMPEE